MPNWFSEGRNYKNRKGILIQRLWVFEFRYPVLYFKDVSELRVPPNLTLRHQIILQAPRVDPLHHVGLTYKCIKHRLRRIFNLGGGGLKQLRAKQADQALARGIRGVPGGWPLARIAKGQHLLPKKIWYFANYICLISGFFFSEITEMCDFRWSQGGSLLFIRECVFRGTINSQFQSLFCQKSYVCIRFWGFQGPPWLRKSCIWYAKYA